jgi:signal transduction histidine kinase
LSRIKSRNAAFAAYGVLLVLPTLVFGWLYWRTLVRDYEAQLAEAPNEAHETAALLVERMQERLGVLLDQEARRPFSHYAKLFTPADTLGDDLAVQPSPLTKERMPVGVLGWFSYDRLRWPAGEIAAFVGGGLEPAERIERELAIERAALTFRELKEAEGQGSRAAQMVTPRSQHVPANIIAVMVNDESNLACLTQHRALMRGWSPEIDLSDFFLEFYRDESGVPRAVASRRVIMSPEYHPLHDPDRPLDAPCLAPLNEGLSLLQGFFLDVDWLIGALVDEVGALTLRESERLVKLGRDAGIDASCEVCADVYPIEVLGFTALNPDDDRVGAVQVAVNTTVIHDRFRRQRNFFGAMAAMMIVVLMTGMLLIERTVSRDLEQAERMQNFVSSVTHELRTPLAAIRLYGEMLLERWTDDPERMHEYHARIVRETNRLSTLVERVLQQGRLSSGKAPVEAIDLSAAVEALLDELRAAHPAKSPFQGGNADLRLDLGRDLPPAYASAECVAGVLINLVENARKYAPVDAGAEATERILVRTFAEDGRVVLEVADRGPGIPPSERDRVFEAFHRLGNEATRTATGTGLGLHLVRLQAEAVGAEAILRARPGGGSIFRVRFRPADGAR